MDVLQHGAWEIKSVTLNNAPVHPDDGYMHLIVSQDQLRIEPLGIELKICQATPRSMMLESNSQIFWADINQSKDRLQLKIERQMFRETILLEAEYQPLAV